MEKQFFKKNGVVRVFGGALFMGVFILNILLFVDTDNNTMSLASLKAYAQTGGGNNEEEQGTKYAGSHDEITTLNGVPCVIYTPPGEPHKVGTNNLTTIAHHCDGTGDEDCTVTITMEETECL